MRRTVGAILFVLGACAPTIDPDSSIEALRKGPLEYPVPSSRENQHNDLTIARDLERVRRISARIFETAFELCATSSDKAGKPLIVTGIRSHEGNFTDAELQSYCRYSLEIEPDARPNATISGSRIRLTRGMVRFARQDAELAFALAHEVAHGLLGHGSAPFWRDRKSIELEADRMGLQLLARAGYQVESAADLLRRMADVLPHSERPDSSYPTYKARAAAVRSMVREMRHRPDRYKMDLEQQGSSWQ